MKGHAAAGSRYLDPLSDTGFMRLFGNNAPREILIDFLNTLLKGDEVVSEVEHRSDCPSGPHPPTGEVLLNLLCSNKKGEQFPVHLQRSCQELVYESLFYHSARMLRDQPEPEEVKVGFQRRAYVLGLMNFMMPICDKDRHRCITDRRMIVQIGSLPGNVHYDVNLLLKSIEVPRYRVSEKGLQSNLDKWLFLLKNLSGMNGVPGPLKNTLFEKVFLAAAS